MVDICLYQAEVDDGEICPTPDAPRGQTKAPRLDIYRPAPRVVVDTGKPLKNKPPEDDNQLPENNRPPQDQYHLQDKSRPQGDGPAMARAHLQHNPRLSRPHKKLPPEDYHHFQDNSRSPGRPCKNLLPEDQRQLQDKSDLNGDGPIVPQSQSKISEIQDPQPVPSRMQSKTSVPKDHVPLIAQTHNSISQPRSHHSLQSEDMEVHTKLSEPKITRSKNLEEPRPTQIKPPASQDHSILQTLSRQSRVELAENGDVRDDDVMKKKKRRTVVERTHQHDHHHPEDANEEDREVREMKRTSAPVNDDPDYAVKYRLGLVPRRSDEPKRRSEYQRQFQWRRFELNSPLMSASQVTTQSDEHVYYHLAANGWIVTGDDT